MIEMEIKDAIMFLKVIDGFCESMEASPNYMEALKIAISALEKQIAKTPYYEGDGYADWQLVCDTWICPSCGEHYEVGYDNQEYCPNCGQHIRHEDWESD